MIIEKIKQLNLTASQKEVLRHLLDIMNTEQVATASALKMSEDCFVSVRTVTRSIRKFIDRQYLVIISNVDENGTDIENSYKMFPYNVKVDIERMPKSGKFLPYGTRYGYQGASGKIYKSCADAEREDDV